MIGYAVDFDGLQGEQFGEFSIDAEQITVNVSEFIFDGQQMLDYGIRYGRKLRFDFHFHVQLLVVFVEFL